MEQKLGVYVCKYYSDNIQQLLTYLKYKGSAYEVDVLWNAADVQNKGRMSRHLEAQTIYGICI